jgi:signal transduction histidine kinase
MTMSPSLMPHAVCWRQDPHLIWAMVVTNAITFASYFSICTTLFYMARKTRRSIMRDWRFFLVGFALFIVACGSTHLMEVVTTWDPVFWVDAWTNIVTAALSGYVAMQFFRRAPELSFGINDYADKLSHAVTEKTQVEDSLLAARKLEEWNRMSTVVTHEINNPLGAVQNLLFLIQGSANIAPEAAAMAQQASDEVRRIGTITRSTLGFFRQDQKPENVDLRTSAESVRFLLHPMLRQRGLELEIECAGDCAVNAYSMETRQVLLNLVRNACEATAQRGGRVRITISGGAEDVRVEVEDEGVGMDAASLGNLFQFGVSTKGERGNGIGLWTVKRLVSRHGGTIEVESTPGKGSRFTVRWPRRIPAERVSPADMVALAGAH